LYHFVEKDYDWILPKVRESGPPENWILVPDARRVAYRDYLADASVAACSDGFADRYPGDPFRILFRLAAMRLY